MARARVPCGDFCRQLRIPRASCSVSVSGGVWDCPYAFICRLFLRICRYLRHSCCEWSCGFWTALSTLLPAVAVEVSGADCRVAGYGSC